MPALLEIERLSAHFTTEEGRIKAVNEVSLRILPGETVCIVGESGCGKSVTAMSVMGLLQGAGVEIGGRIKFGETDLLSLDKHHLRTIRGHEIAMIFQEPMSSLNPVLTIGEQMIEPMVLHLKLPKKVARRRAVELIEQVGISRPEQIMNNYPHELSGGMLQRVMIAMAISCGPRLLIADEPTTALDVTIQAQILDMLRRIKEESNMAILLITHDLGVVAEMADYVVVMYAGKIVEEGEVTRLFASPKHPYTQGLLKSKPFLGQRRDELFSIPGQVPNLLELTPSCYFHDRCADCMDVCRTKEPALGRVGDGQKAACWLYEEGERHG
ncbi:ABC transporter ATP-binding protein [Paenibacillus macerans]|uniref:ATP-binding cassette domain-containing protein n=1 Tax=Paenibacillus macerans TaxID=44252 RepID=A0A6N8F7Q1_PAEMA|nr:ABC transporter ATP-binding protein [Paenibacillus macerans]MBS5910815.1 ABC transporter ATP-binding protein [Paenibacillus macerans]MCY7559274.1 ABC transporter ATP-binding protein [Paenibacillus macerans]MEC0139033.1 ABC transporter ATP-binding protein [Paenibacillus macerans]MEC0152988.1 ABC transporter ATP-binding protein [Paenibacillus macerans]MUG26701.1 ATP-binding cassette domain-containing protein [Paenibacillus macerans]